MKQVSTGKGIAIIVGFAVLVVLIGGLVGTGIFSTDRPPEPERINYNPSLNNPEPQSEEAATTPTTASPAPAKPATAAGSGTYEVGTDLQAGRYKTAGSDRRCYWERTKDTSGEFNSIIANDSFDGPSYVTVNTGEFVKFSGGCTWELQS
jgi:hypothetical protein